MSAGLAQNWWAIGLQSIAAMLFGVSVLALPRSAVASLILLFAAYVAADGAFPILAGARAMRRGERRWTLIIEGVTNILVAGAVLIWSALAVAPFVRLASAWAVVTRASMLAAARRHSGSHGRPFLVLAGTVSITWGIVATATGPSFVGGARKSAKLTRIKAAPGGRSLIDIRSGPARDWDGCEDFAGRAGAWRRYHGARQQFPALRDCALAQNAGAIVAVDWRNGHTGLS
jgi:uncharacterized membrane protein HdeD (DUF308 family)